MLEEKKARLMEKKQDLKI
jgi:hypothetical protein